MSAATTKQSRLGDPVEAGELALVHVELGARAGYFDDTAEEITSERTPFYGQSCEYHAEMAKFWARRAVRYAGIKMEEMNGSDQT